MDRQDLINTCVFEQFQGLLFSDLSGPLTCSFKNPMDVHLHLKVLHLGFLTCLVHNHVYSSYLSLTKARCSRPFLSKNCSSASMPLLSYLRCIKEGS